MIPPRSYFFCGVGGSGMAPLARIVQSRGAEVAGSDRAHDHGRLPAKFAQLAAQGVRLHPQDGSGLNSADQILVVSAAVEESIADVQAARRLGARIVTRAELLAELFNAAPVRVGVAGTSGKSTTTGMLAWILHAAGRDPTVMNGAEMRNFITPETPLAGAGARVGAGEVFVSEVDESDGSIALFAPTIAVVTNVSLDHKTLDELRALFAAFAAKADRVVLNLDDAETTALAAALAPDRTLTFSLDDPDAGLRASDPDSSGSGIAFDVDERQTGARARVVLQTPGMHNVANALAALGAARACNVPLDQGAEALGGFAGIRRRLEVVGCEGGVTVIDDFAHNPDKIAATLRTLHARPGRLLVMFQPHGYGPLKLMGDALVETFATELAPGDVLLMPEPVYFGGAVDRSIGSRAIAGAVAARGREAEALSDRAACGGRLAELARPGDRIVIMGARDDTLSDFAAEVLRALA